jgi:hypothetical protein
MLCLDSRSSPKEVGVKALYIRSVLLVTALALLAAFLGDEGSILWGT